MISRLLILLGLLTGALLAQVTPNQVSSGPLANRPVTCQLNDLYFATDQPAYNNTFYCASQNNWILVSGTEQPIDLTVHNLIATGTISGVLIGNASTATALAAAPTVCSAGMKPSGVDTHGNSIGCSSPVGSVASVFGRTGTVTAVSGDYSAFYDAIGAATTAVAGIPSASTTLRGLLTAADWNTFNGKDAGGAAAAAQAAAQAFSANGSNITSGTVASARVPLAQAASALAATPTACSTETAANGVFANGNPTACERLACPNILNYGGSNNGSTPNDTALTALFAANISDQQCVYLGPGHFFFANTAAWTAPTATASITFKGEGSGVTQLIFPSGKDGIALNLISTANAFHVKNLTLRTRGTGTSVAINVNNTGTAMAEGVLNSITNNSTQGDDCQACTNYWATHIRLHNTLSVSVSGNHLVGSPSLGTAISIDATGTPVSVIFNINNNVVDYVHDGLIIGDSVQGVTLAQNNFTGVVNGLFVPTGIVYGHNDELIIGPGNQFAGSSTGISINSPIRHTQVFNNYFVVGPSGTGMSFDHYAMTTVSNNQLINVGAPGNGITFANYSNDTAQVFGNTTEFFNFGLLFTAASQHITALANIGVGNTTDVSNSGTGNAVSVTFTGSPTAAFQVVNGVVIHQ